MQYQIRTAEIQDVEIVVQFNAAMALETEGKSLDQEILKNGVESAIQNSTRAIYFLAENQGEIIGQLMLTTEWSDWRNGFFWWIQSVYVKPDWRKKGVFKALYQHVEVSARKNLGVCGLRLYVEKENFVAQRTYEKLGMTATAYSIYEVEF